MFQKMPALFDGLQPAMIGLLEWSNNTQEYSGEMRAMDVSSGLSPLHQELNLEIFVIFLHMCSEEAGPNPA